MASSMSVYCQIIQEGLAAKRKEDHAELARLLADGIETDEAHRRVYHPWKTLAQYREMMAEYDRAYATPSLGGKRKSA